MNTNEIKYIEDNEPTEKELNKRLITLAEEAQDESTGVGMVGFYWFLIGWLSPKYHAEMAHAARAWLNTYHPAKLEEFDSLNRPNSY